MCENCKETFNLSTKMPYLLPCGHTLCRFCLENIWEKQKKLKCPFDQIEHINHIDSLPRNEILVDIIKTYFKKVMISCFICFMQTGFLIITFII